MRVSILLPATVTSLSVSSMSIPPLEPCEALITVSPLVLVTSSILHSASQLLLFFSFRSPRSSHSSIFSQLLDIVDPNAKVDQIFMDSDSDDDFDDLVDDKVPPEVTQETPLVSIPPTDIDGSNSK
ncbi:uncharacterized protein DS421_17g588310 [Arachis hypogaea]|nr:uncharacterized protein DS421_17g588310 [Arachis hypogaea]